MRAFILSLYLSLGLVAFISLFFETNSFYRFCNIWIVFISSIIVLSLLFPNKFNLKEL